jgi:hypothetical protein
MKKCTLYKLFVFNFLSAEKRSTSKKQEQALRVTIPYVLHDIKVVHKAADRGKYGADGRKY